MCREMSWKLKFGKCLNTWLCSTLLEKLYLCLETTHLKASWISELAVFILVCQSNFTRSLKRLFESSWFGASKGINLSKSG